jgi:heme/copper-type cytochrome/quinol oxidase subunit 1
VKRAILVPALGVLLVTAGVVVALATPRETSIGWFAYAPLSDAVFLPAGTLLVRGEQLIAAALVVLGLLVLAFWTGTRWASRGGHARKQG